jgi:transposase-like protein
LVPFYFAQPGCTRWMGAIISYGVAYREVILEAVHSTEQYKNNQAEQSHEATRVRERGMRGPKSAGQAQRFLGAHTAIENLFNVGRHLVRAAAARKRQPGPVFAPHRYAGLDTPRR